MSRMHRSVESWPRISRMIPAAIATLAISACASTTEPPLKPLDKVLAGVPNPAMQEKWRSADAAGKLPPIDAIPTVKQGVTQRRPVMLQVAATEPQRPAIPPQTVATVQPFSRTPVVDYVGTFQVTSHKPGVLIGTLKDRAEPLALYYKLPGKTQLVDIKEQTALNLLLRDDVVDTALQRRVVLHTGQGTTPFVFIAEGSPQPYKQMIEVLQLTIEQLPFDEAPKGEERYPPVKLTYGADTLTLKPGERGNLGEGERAVEAYLLESLAVGTQRALLREGQPYYVNVMLYRAP